MLDNSPYSIGKDIDNLEYLPDGTIDFVEAND